jgi:hypothetical protein
MDAHEPRLLSSTIPKRRTAMMKGISILLVLILGISTQLFGFPESETQKDKPKQKTEAAQNGNRKVKDPVCEMEIDSKSAAGKATYKGKTSAPSRKRSSLKRNQQST